MKLVIWLSIWKILALVRCLLKKKKKTFHEAWSDIILDLNNFYSFEILCYVNRENVMKLENQNVKCRLLEYEIFNQYKLWDVQKRQIIRAAHVIFDEFITFPQWKKVDENFNYVTLNFFINKKSTTNEVISIDIIISFEITISMKFTIEKFVIRLEKIENVENDDIEENSFTSFSS